MSAHELAQLLGDQFRQLLLSHFEADSLYLGNKCTYSGELMIRVIKIQKYLINTNVRNTKWGAS